MTSPQLKRVLLSAAIATSIGLGANPLIHLPQGHAEVPSSSMPGSDTVSSAIGSSTLKDSLSQAAWGIRNQISDSAYKILPASIAVHVSQAADTTVEALFPGIHADHAGIAPNPPAAPASPCPADAKVCVDINAQKAWLQDGQGHRVSSPINISTGADGYDTPQGTFHVNRKVILDKSIPYNEALMPYSVYFTNTGIAFHEGDPQALSHGCVHVPPGESQRYFNHLNPGDKVYVWGDLDYGQPNGPVRR